MKYKIIAFLVVFITLISGAYAYQGFSGYNEYYYTDNYTPTVYYPTPYTTPNYYNSIYSNTQYNSYYSTYPTTYYYNAYYPAYRYGPRVITYAPAYYAYPTTYRSLSIYRGNDGWGINYSSGTSICSIYGYC